MTENLYHYKAELIRVVDGDTIDVDIDLGFDKIRTRQRLRLLEVDTPERSEIGFAEATEFVKQRLSASKQIIINTVRKDSFGRWLAMVWYDGKNLNQELFDMGWEMK